MQILQTPQFSTLRPPKPAISKTLHKPSTSNFNLSPFILYHLSSNNRISLKNRFTAKSSFYASDEVPVDEEFLKRFGPKEVESPEQARRRDWVERGWAPWEEILTPEADFARKSLDEGFEVPLKSPEAIEAFKMLRPSYVKKKIEEMGITEDEFYERQFEIKGEMLDPLETYWDGPLVVSHVAPRDWPPKGWEVDSKELEFIREAHKTISERVSLEDVENAADGGSEGQNICLERYDVFLKQYYDWVEHNKDRLEEESYKYDQDYHPGRRKRGKDYKEGMYELPFYYPGQICVGTVTTLHLYQGAFVDIGGVYEGWVPIQGNDWFWIRQYIKVGMRVTVEVMAKRDPYRFRFPIELRFVDPNIDHMIFRRFEFPPIFHRDEDNSPDELRRDCGRPPIPRRDPEIKWEEEPLLCNHPYVDKLWQIHVAEQMILDDMEANPEKYEGKVLSELTDEEDFDEKNSVEYGKVRYKKTIMPRVTLKQSVGELDLEAALAERQLNKKLEKEAEARGEELKISMLRRNHEMNEYDYMHWRRSVEEREALIRDISSRKALGLPLEEPGRYVDQSFFGEQYDPSNPVYRYDYWGEPKSSDKSKKERIIDAHNKAIVGKGTVLNEMSYEEAIKLQEEKENLAKEEARRRQEDEKNKQERMQQDDADEEYEWDDFDFSLLDDVDDSNSIVDTDASQPHVNGTQSSRISDEGIFED